MLRVARSACRVWSARMFTSALPETGIFAEAQFAGTRRPLGEATCLPAHVFINEAWHERELKSVFRPSWTLIGRADELTAPGSYLTLHVPGVGPVVAVKGKDHVIRAFHNVCRHRGAMLLSECSGRLKGGIVCPYHGWAYDATGNLR